MIKETTFIPRMQPFLALMLSSSNSRYLVARS